MFESSAPLRTPATNLLLSRLHRSQRLTLTKPFNRRRFKRALRLRRLCHPPLASLIDYRRAGEIQDLLAIEGRKAVSAFEAFGAAMGRIRPFSEGVKRA